MTHLTPVPSQPAAVMDDTRMEALYDKYGHTLHRYLLTLTFGDRHLAEDILQETLLRAWRTPDLDDRDGRSVRAWLWTVGRNIVIDRLRHRGRRPQETTTDDLPQLAEPTCEMDRVVTSLTVRRAIAKLTPARRQILIEMYFNERSLNELSESLSIPIGTVKSRAHYALRALRSHLGDDAPAAA